jgi:uncharacterized damage-inducible protein DinB
MTVKDLERIYDYHYWANRKLFAVVATLTPEEFTRPVAGSYGSIRNTLVHTLSAEWGWLERCGGATRGPALKAEDFPTFAPLQERWTLVEGHVRAFLAGLTDVDVTRIVEFPALFSIRGGQLGSLMQHGAIHAVHHRGQVALLLRALGKPSGNFDILFYDADQHALLV